MKKTRKVKTEKLTAEAAAPKRGRGRPRKDESVAVSVTPKKKRGRPRKVMVEQAPYYEKTGFRKIEAVAEASKKRGRKPKVETKQEKLTKIAKLGKRKYASAVEDMAMEKITKRVKRKGSVGNGIGAQHGEPVSVKSFDYEKYSTIAASPTKAPVGANGMIKKNEPVIEKPTLPILDRIKQRLTDRGYKWKSETFKVVEKTPEFWTVEFIDKKQGEITNITNVIQLEKERKIDEEHTNGKVKISKLSKVGLNQYIKKLVARGLHPTNIKVLENTPEYFRIEFNDGEKGELVTCGHVKGWDV